MMALTIGVHQILWKTPRKRNRDPNDDQTSVPGRMHEPYMGYMNGKVQNSPTPKKAKQKSKGKSTLIIFFDIKGIVYQEFVLAGQIFDLR
jgi:hypothetical protein